MPLIFMKEEKIYICPVTGITSLEIMDFADAHVSSSPRERQEAIDTLVNSKRYGQTENEVRTYLSGHIFQCQCCQQDYKYHLETLSLLQRLVRKDLQSL